MYLAILFLPFIGILSRGLLGRKLGRTGSQLITTGCLIIRRLLSLVAFYEVALCNSPVSIILGNWFNIEYLVVNWGFLFDRLTVSILLPVLIVSSLVHLYSMSYIANDPHTQRFFCYLSIFTFFMLVLVTGDNYIILFVGWEGNRFALDVSFENILTAFSVFGVLIFNTNKKIRSTSRIGPHNFYILEALVGSLIGDSHLEKRGDRPGIRAKFEQSREHGEYLIWLHNLFSLAGYCSLVLPQLITRVRDNGTFYSYRFNTFSFSSFSWLYNAFYIDGVKCLPIDILEVYLTPFAIAIWFIDDGSLCGSGYKIRTHGFSKEELEKLVAIVYVAKIWIRMFFTSRSTILWTIY